MAQDKLIDVISSILEISPDSVNDDLSVDSCPNWDSMNHMNLILALEEVYGLKIADDVALDLLSFTAIKKYIETLKK